MSDLADADIATQAASAAQASTESAAHTDSLQDALQDPLVGDEGDAVQMAGPAGRSL